MIVAVCDGGCIRVWLYMMVAVYDGGCIVQAAMFRNVDESGVFVDCSMYRCTVL